MVTWAFPHTNTHDCLKPYSTCHWLRRASDVTQGWGCTRAAVFWVRYNEHFYMQSHAHKTECFNRYKLQSGRIGDYPGWGYQMVDYLMALHLHNVMAATQWEHLDSCSFVAALPAVCKGYIPEEHRLNGCFPVLHFLCLCPETQGQKANRVSWKWLSKHDSTHHISSSRLTLRSLWPQHSSRVPLPTQKQTFLYKQNVRLAVTSAMQRVNSIPHREVSEEWSAGGSRGTQPLPGSFGTLISIHVKIVC